MDESLYVKVREIELKDIDFIANYWFKFDSNFLVRMRVYIKKLPNLGYFRIK